MYPKLFDKDELKDFFATPVLRRFPSLSQFEDIFSNQNSGLRISEGTNDISILADMPGLNADEIEVTLENGILQIKGEKKEEEFLLFRFFGFFFVVCWGMNNNNGIGLTKEREKTLLQIAFLSLFFFF